MAFTTIEITISELFQSSFGRPVSSLQGMAAWVSRYNLKTAAGLTDAEAQKGVLHEMNLSTESKGIYGTLTAVGIVDFIFSNSLGRTANEPGRSLWIERASKVPLEQIQSEILAAARTNSDFNYMNNLVKNAESDISFSFTEEWLNGKTFYSVMDDDDNGTLTDIEVLSFNNGEFTDYDINVPTDVYGGSYFFLDNGILQLNNTGGEIDYYRELELNTDLNALEIATVNEEDNEYSYLVNSTRVEFVENNDIEYFFFDLDSANDFIEEQALVAASFATPISITFDDPDSELFSYQTQIIDNIQSAWDAWDVYIDAHPDASIEFVIRPINESGVLARAGSASSVWLYDNVYQDSVSYELIHGEDTTGVDFDALIFIETQSLNQSGFYNFTPEEATTDEQISFNEVMIHEVGHVLGFNGWFDDPAFSSPYEELVDKTSATFIGENAVATNGGPVDLNIESLSHLSEQIFPDSSMSTYSNWGGGQVIS